MLVILGSLLCGCAIGFISGGYNVKLLDEEEIFNLKSENESLNKQLNNYRKRGRKHDN